MNKKLIITLDGPAGSGKSTIARLVAKKMKISYLDTGAMYRAITYKYIITGQISASIKFDNQKIILDGIDVSDKIRSIEVSEKVAEIAAKKEVREKLIEEQRKIAKGQSIIVDGRDMGMVVFPDADYKF